MALKLSTIKNTLQVVLLQKKKNKQTKREREENNKDGFNAIKIESHMERKKKGHLLRSIWSSSM